MKNLCTRCLVKARLGGWDGAMVSYQLSIYPSSAGWSWLSWRWLSGGWRNREEKLCAGHDAAAAVQRSTENNIQTEYFCLSPFCLQDLLSLEFRNFDIDFLAFTPLGGVFVQKFITNCRWWRQFVFLVPPHVERLNIYLSAKHTCRS